MGPEVLSQVTVVQLFPAVAVCGVQLATGVGTVVVGAGQVVVVHPLPPVAALGVQLATGTFVVLFTLQVVVTQSFAVEPVLGRQDSTPTGPVLAVAHVV